MSKYKIEILPAAWEDLQTIEDYYVLNFGADTAIKVSEAILDFLERLEKFPDSGSLTPDAWLNEQGYRMIISKRHVSIVKLVGQIIYIYHIADTKTEYTKLFGKKYNE